MARTISIGAQGFGDIRTHGCFYVDKTSFVRDWWHAADPVTLVCRPRRFGKTLNMDTVRCFFSSEFGGRGEELFGGLAVWDDPEMRALQGTFPVVALTFATVKPSSMEGCMRAIKKLLGTAADAHLYLVESPKVSERDRRALAAVGDGMADEDAADALALLCRALHAHWGVKPIVLLDEYDVPMQAAWLGGFWDEMAAFVRSMMTSTFKANASLGRGLITGVTRVARESVFSGLNNLEVVGLFDTKYQTAFGFTQDEVDAALEEFGMSERRDVVKQWYDGFTFGGAAQIYNPWSITKLLDGGIVGPHWMNTSDNALAADVVRQNGADMEGDFEELMRGGTVEKVVDEQVAFIDLAASPGAAWGLLLASGYLTCVGPAPTYFDEPRRLKLTNLEVLKGFDQMVARWFMAGDGESYGYDGFVKAMLAGDAKEATHCLNDVTLACMSSFDGATHTAESQPERFYHGLVLGLLATLRGRYAVESNRESGRGRYDVTLVPCDGADGVDPAAVIEFKVFDPNEEDSLEGTCARALAQISEKAYTTALSERGIAAERILRYGIAFRGKEALVVRA